MSGGVREVLPEAVSDGQSEPRRPVADSEPNPAPSVHRPGGERQYRWITIGVLLLVIAAGAIVAFRRWHAARAWPEGLIRVNGRIEGDHVTVASKFPGRVTRLVAREGDTVAKDQVIVQIDDAQTRARLQQAEANLQAAVAQAKGAGEGVALTAETTAAQVLQAQGLVNQAEAAIAAANAEVARADGAVAVARFTAASAGAGVETARAALTAALANRQRAADAIRAGEAQVETAQASARAARAAVEAAEAANEKAGRDARRFRTLVAEGAVSEQTGDVYAAAEKTARAQWESARQQATAAEAVVSTRQAEVSAARRQLEAADAAVQQARAQVGAARQQAAAARADIRQAEASLGAARQMVRQAQARRQQAVGELKRARTAPHQVAVSESARSQAQARIRQARATVAELRSVLQDLSVVAPVSGTVTTRLVDVGEVVGAGTPLLELVDLDRLYLKAYVPEHQIGKVRLELPARVYVDAFPEEPFEAEVRYIASTAEFTPKEVQTPDERVKLVYAVQLYLNRNPDHRLTPGMPADGVIRWKKEIEWRKPQW